MSNGDVHDQVSDQYLQQFDRSVGVSGMQKLQSFPELQKLGHAGTLSHQKKDFHGLQDFKSQMAKYSHVSHTLRIAWSLISFIVPNNPSIQKQLFTAPGLGSVGDAFKSIHGFGQVFSLSPSDLKSPAAVQSKASVYKNQSVHASVVTDYSSKEAIGGGASPTSPGNASALNGFLIAGTPTAVNNSLSYDNATNTLIWGPGGTGGGGGGSSSLAGDTDVTLTSPTDGQFLVYSTGSGKWVNHSLVAGDVPSLPESKITGLVSDLATLSSAILSEASTRASADSAEASTRASADALLQPLSGKDAASGYAGLTAGGLLNSAEFPAPTVTTFGGVKDVVAVSHQFVNAVTSGVPQLGQPTFTDLSSHPTTLSGYGITDALSSGTVLPATKTLISHQFFTSYDATTGLFTAAQPSYSDISGTPQLAVTKTLVTHQFFTSYDSTTGLFTAAQPAAADLSDGTSGTGAIVLASALASEASARTAADALKEDVANKSTNTSLGTSDTLYPSQKAVKTYVDAVSGSGTGLASGTSVATTNDSYTAGQRRAYDLAMAKTFAAWKVTEATGKKFRLQLYATSAARSADSARGRTVPLALGSQHGCLLDMYIEQSVAVTPFMLSPPVLGSNDDGTQATTIYAAVTSAETTTQSIQVTISYVQLEL